MINVIKKIDKLNSEKNSKKVCFIVDELVKI